MNVVEDGQSVCRTHDRMTETAKGAMETPEDRPFNTCVFLISISLCSRRHRRGDFCALQGVMDRTVSRYAEPYTVQIYFLLLTCICDRMIG